MSVVAQERPSTKWGRARARLLERSAKRLDKGPGRQSKKRARLPKVQPMPPDKLQARHRTRQPEPPSKPKTLRDKQPSKAAVRTSRGRRQEATRSLRPRMPL